MGQRIRQLEDAVSIFQSGVSSETHPLMRDELLGIKFGPEIAHIAQGEDTTPKELSLDAIDALGTLTIGNSGESKYFGRSAGSEVLCWLCLAWSNNSMLTMKYPRRYFS